MKASSLMISLTFALMLMGCTPIGVVEKAVSVVAKPILSLGVKDALTTLAWVEGEVKAGRLSSVDADLAKRCPEVVIALEALRTRMNEETAEVEGFKGLIYYGTKNRFGQGVQAEASRHLKQFAEACLPLIPAEKLIKIF